MRWMVRGAKLDSWAQIVYTINIIIFIDVLIDLFYSWRPYKLILAMLREKYGVKKRWALIGNLAGGGVPGPWMTLNAAVIKLVSITSGDENHLCRVSLCKSHKISLKAQRHENHLCGQAFMGTKVIRLFWKHKDMGLVPQSTTACQSVTWLSSYLSNSIGLRSYHNS